MSGRPTQYASAHALLIEDDPVSREFLGEALASAGWRIELAADVATALQKARQAPPALVLCDLRLPDGSAFDVARSLWPEFRTASAARPHAVALSAEVDESLRTRLHHAGFASVLSKPVSLSDLLAALPALPWSSTAALAERTWPEVRSDGVDPAVLDDAAALSVCGSVKTVEAMRDLLAIELAQSLAAIRTAQAAGDADMLDETFHRLRSACGFCGAAALGAAVAAVGPVRHARDLRSQAVAHVLDQGSALASRLADRGRRITQ